MSPRPPLLPWLLVALALLAAPDPSMAQAVGEPSPTTADPAVRLPALEVRENDDESGFDRTGMGTFEEQMRDAPFSNDLVDTDDFSNDADEPENDAELAAIAEPSAAERIAGESRLNLRGFPTPNLRDGFIQIGIPETLNTSQTIVIQGALVPVLGRAAPGGIRNAMTARPRAKTQTRLQTSANDRHHQRLSYEHTGALIDKKLWQRIALSWDHREGPEEFARDDTKQLSAALTWRRSRAVSLMLSLDYRETKAHASPGIPEYREHVGARIKGPYLPLAYFNANGPDAAILRRSTTAGLQFDTAPSANFALRANLEAWQRAIDQDRFTSSQLNLDTGLFSGTREPRHLAQPQEAVSAQVEGTLRFQKLGALHKLLLSANHTLGEYRREERALSPADRDALPSGARHFNPWQPDYSRPAYSPARYSRILIDRLEVGRYTSAEISDRLAFQHGRWVLTAGFRFDQVSQAITDFRPIAARPPTRDRTSQLSH
ncbi:MAG: TonB-dependent receptor, partial [Opitutaceae bacterium]|nr:TonB-dependent receptor [Opitutaceae bacterium]